MALSFCILTNNEWGRGQWQPTPVLLPGGYQGLRSLVGCSPWGWEELGTTGQLHFHFSLSCIGEGNGNPLQCSCLENPRDRGAWWAAVLGSHRVGHDWCDLAAAAAAWPWDSPVNYKLALAKNICHNWATTITMRAFAICFCRDWTLCCCSRWPSTPSEGYYSGEWGTLAPGKLVEQVFR